MVKSIFQVRVKILKNVEVAPGYFKILLDAPVIAKSARPGQFVEIKVFEGCAPLLRRPLSIHRIDGSKIEILYGKLGQGTEILSQKHVGENLDIIGPLGNGFDYSAPEHQRTSAPVLVAGGMGVAPLVFLAERLAYSVERRAYSKDKNKLSAKRYLLNTKVLIGAKTKAAILCENEFKALRCDVQIATDDGSRGFKGRVTDLLEKLLSAKRYPLNATIYACGPKPMLKELALISKENNVAAQVSLEGHMACGIGACLGCVVNTRQGYKRACKEGPVFDAQDIVW